MSGFGALGAAFGTDHFRAASETAKHCSEQLETTFDSPVAASRPLSTARCEATRSEQEPASNLPCQEQLFGLFSALAAQLEPTLSRGTVL